MKYNKNIQFKCFRRKYLKPSKNRGCGNGATTSALFPFALWSFALWPFALSRRLLYTSFALYVICSIRLLLYIQSAL